MSKIRLPKKLRCLRCKEGHEWTPRKDEVRICPKCKSPYWDVPRPLRDEKEAK